jgi:cytidylate kinase
MIKNLLIAIDGPSASGKGTLAKKIAQYFNLPYLNTGALYRFLAYKMIQTYATSPSAKQIQILIQNLNIKEADLENEELFSEEVGTKASEIAQKPEIRKALFDFQQQFAIENKAKFGGAVLEGRDTTTIICPDANYKFFIAADVEIRAKRRFEQLKLSGREVRYEEILNQLKQRDKNDYERKEAPLKIAKDAFIIDNSYLSIEESFNNMITIIKKPYIK